ncbi:signal recognition particle-docking protein FtsY [Xanthobacter sp. V4C-4]
MWAKVLSWGQKLGGSDHAPAPAAPPAASTAPPPEVLAAGDAAVTSPGDVARAELPVADNIATPAPDSAPATPADVSVEPAVTIGEPAVAAGAPPLSEAPAVALPAATAEDITADPPLAPSPLPPSPLPPSPLDEPGPDTAAEPVPAPVPALEPADGAHAEAPAPDAASPVAADVASPAADPAAALDGAPAEPSPETAPAAQVPAAEASDELAPTAPASAHIPPPEPPLAADALATPLPTGDATPRKSFWARLTSGLARTASSLGQGIADLVTKRKLDAETLEDLEDILIRADLGVETAMRIVEAVGKGRHDKMIAPEEVKGLIAAEVERILTPVAQPLVVEPGRRPFVVLMVGVNGSGKTTTIGKLAAQWRQEGKTVVLAAGDTFRAAAVEQLKVWGARTGTKVVAREPGADAAGVAHEALLEARADGADILLIDTAGRLQNRSELMAELEKIVRVVKKLESSAPHAVLLVLDATVGQNALSQVEAFTRIAGVTGLVMTKLDGTARGGILVAIAAKHRLPVHLIGVGEGAEDLQPFTARDFARAIAGLD